MNESWPTMTTMGLMGVGKPSPEVSETELDALLGGRKFGQGTTDLPMEMNPPVENFDESEMQELEAFCRARGIVGVNFNGMRPAAVLKMLKGKMGMHENTTKKGLLHD